MARRQLAAQFMSPYSTMATSSAPRPRAGGSPLRNPGLPLRLSSWAVPTVFVSDGLETLPALARRPAELQWQSRAQKYCRLDLYPPFCGRLEFWHWYSLLMSESSLQGESLALRDKGGRLTMLAIESTRRDDLSDPCRVPRIINSGSPDCWRSSPPKRFATVTCPAWPGYPNERGIRPTTCPS